MAANKDFPPFHKAAWDGDRIGIEEMLSAGKHGVNEEMADGLTALYLASHQGHSTLAAFLIEYKADVNQARNTGSTPLWIAASKGKSQVVDVLVAHGADVDRANRTGHTPLYVACQNGQVQVVESLVRAGASVNQATAAGETPLFIAAQKGHVGVCRLLGARGASINQPRPNGSTPLWIAAAVNNVDVVKCLLVMGADVNAKGWKGTTARDIARMHKYVDVMREIDSHAQVAGESAGRKKSHNRGLSDNQTVIKPREIGGGPKVANTLPKQDSEALQRLRERERAKQTPESGGPASAAAGPGASASQPEEESAFSTLKNQGGRDRRDSAEMVQKEFADARSTLERQGSGKAGPRKPPGRNPSERSLGSASERKSQDSDDLPYTEEEDPSQWKTGEADEDLDPPNAPGGPVGARPEINFGGVPPIADATPVDDVCVVPGCNRSVTYVHLKQGFCGKHVPLPHADRCSLASCKDEPLYMELATRQPYCRKCFDSKFKKKWNSIFSPKKK